ncbi:hypothetical protein SERLADRAFT_469559, partial [Serpula lacrymans var. lacrymans S7.9]
FYSEEKCQNVGGSFHCIACGCLSNETNPLLPSLPIVVLQLGPRWSGPTSSDGAGVTVKQLSPVSSALPGSWHDFNGKFLLA